MIKSKSALFILFNELCRTFQRIFDYASQPITVISWSEVPNSIVCQKCSWKEITFTIDEQIPRSILLATMSVYSQLGIYSNVVRITFPTQLLLCLMRQTVEQNPNTHTHTLLCYFMLFLCNATRVCLLLASTTGAEAVPCPRNGLK